MKIKGFVAVFIVSCAIVFLIWVAKSGKEKTVPEVKAYRQAEVDLTKVNMAGLEKTVVSFMAQEGRTPDSLKELRSLHSLPGANVDSWGTAIRYDKVSDEKFRLVSAGRDRAFNTSDDIVVEY